MILTEFSQEEKDLLVPAIQERMTNWKKENVAAKQIGRLYAVEREVKYKLSKLTDPQKVLLTGIIQEYLLDPNQQRIDKYNVLKEERTNSQKEEITKFNSYFILKDKLSTNAEKSTLINA